MPRAFATNVHQGNFRKPNSEFTPDSLRRLIHRQTGLQERNSDPERLNALIHARLHALKLASVEEYATLLRSAGPANRAEVRELTVGLTTGETHFFRDRGQFDLLEQSILPALIKERRASRRLRIWSAGCSNGDEAFSIAIALDSLLMNQPEWKVEIRGTDINPAALEKAKSGTFSSWSFRVISEQRKADYFEKSGDEWVLKPRIRQAVRFSSLDLIHDTFPSVASGIHDFDLILCRNVFIYFEPDSIDRVVEKMIEALRPGGYLLTAHSELSGREPETVEALTFPESSVYRKRLTNSSKPRKNESAVLSGPLAPTPEQSAAASAPDFEARARDCADKGDYKQAEELCQRSLQNDPFAAGTYYLLAKIAEERKDAERSKEILKKVLYLDPDYVAAYVDLAAAYDRENDSGRALRLRLTALDCLRRLEPGAKSDTCEGTSTTELTLALQKLVNGAAIQ